MSAPLLTPDDLAAHFGIERRTVLEWAKRFNWPRTQFGRHPRWTAEQVAEIERTHAVSPTGVVPSDGRTARSARRAR